MKLDKELTYNQPEANVDFKDIKKAIKYSNDNYELLKALSKKAEEKYPKNLPLGGFFDLPVADGKVSYQITEVVGKRAFAKRCAGICLDFYEDMMLGQGAWISTDKANELVNRQRALIKLFGGK